MFKNLKSRLILIAIILVTLFFSVLSVNAMAEQERLALIETIKQQIVALQLQVAQMLGQTGTGSTSQSWCHTFNINLGFANNGSSEVGALQTAMQKQGFLISDNTNIYGSSTETAVKAFQEKYASQILTPSGLLHGTGFTGSATRVKLNQLYACTTNTTNTTITGNNSTSTNSTSTSSNNTTVTNNNTNNAIKFSSTVICNSKWVCNDWGQCQNGQQTRKCFDTNACGDTKTKPVLTQSCSVSCTPQWACSSWSLCQNNQQTRTCVDSHNCNITQGRPFLTQSCGGVGSGTGSGGGCVANCSNKQCGEDNGCGIPCQKGACSSGQDCYNAKCYPIACAQNSDCGTTGFRGIISCSQDSIAQNYETHTCTNPGTFLSLCKHTVELKVKSACPTNQHCINGQCTVACSQDSDCGTSGYTGTASCSQNNVVQSYVAYTCSNPGTSQSKCSVQTAQQTKKACETNQQCSGGKCSTITCSQDSDCEAPGYSGTAFCSGNNVVKNYATYTCSSPGTTQSSCVSHVTPQTQQTCLSTQTCSGGTCTTGTTGGGTTGGGTTGTTDCVPNWECSNWMYCGSYGAGKTWRSCSDANNCGASDGMPAILKDCVKSSFRFTMSNSKTSKTVNGSMEDYSSILIAPKNYTNTLNYPNTLTWSIENADSCKISSCTQQSDNNGGYINSDRCMDNVKDHSIPLSGSEIRTPTGDSGSYTIICSKDGIISAMAIIQVMTKSIGPYWPTTIQNCPQKIYDAIALLQARLIDRYNELRQYTATIKCTSNGNSAAAHVSDDPPRTLVSYNWTNSADTVWTAAMLVHEYIHHKLYTDYLWAHMGPTGVADVPYDIYGNEPGERKATEAEYAVLKALGRDPGPNWVAQQMEKKWWLPGSGTTGASD